MVPSTSATADYQAVVSVTSIGLTFLLASPCLLALGNGSHAKTELYQDPDGTASAASSRKAESTGRLMATSALAFTISGLALSILNNSNKKHIILWVSFPQLAVYFV